MNAIFVLVLLLFLSSCSSIRRSDKVLKKTGSPSVILSPTKESKVLPAKVPVLDNSEDSRMTYVKGLFAKNDFSAVIQFSENWESYKNPTNLYDLFDLRLKSFVSLQANEKAFQLCMRALKSSALLSSQDLIKKSAEDLILFRIRSSELEDLLDTAEDAQLRALILYKLGENFLADRDYNEARSAFAKSVAAAPGTEWSSKSETLLNQLEAVRRVQPKTVGAVLPMTGKHANVGKKALRGLQMGLGLFNNLPSSFELAVVDSEGNPDLARRGVDRLVKEDNVIAVIGSVLSKNASAVATRSHELGVPSINLSQKSGITEVGSTVFRNSLTTEMQARFLVKYAMEQQGISNFAILYPNDAYGTEFANIFWDEVVARGGKIRAVQIYSPKETDFRLVIQRLIGTFYLEDRIDEMQTLLAEQKKDPKKSKSKFEGGNKEKAPEDLLEPVVGFQAIFIPDSVKALGQIAAMLSYNNVKGIKLLGTNLWNSSQLNKRAGAFSESIFFVDSSIDTTTSKPGFIRDYKNLFKEDPGLIEVQAYDSALMIKQLVSNGYSSRESLAQGLSALNQFPGGIGSITATEERDFLRPMTVLTLLNGQIVPSSDNRVRP